MSPRPALRTPGAAPARARAAALAPMLGAAVAVTLTVAAPGAAHAQDRLLAHRTLAAGGSLEWIGFANGGLWQTGIASGDSMRVRDAVQFSIPVTTVVPLGHRLTLDAAKVYTTGAVRFRRADGTDGRATLAGPGDVRLRATSRFLGERLVFTAGANLPTGRTELDASQLAAVRVLAAPALTLGAPPIGAGPSGTVGMLAAQGVGRWALAAGASYERRGTYAPVSALLAGLQTLDFQPGDVTRLTLAADGLVARGRLSLAVSTDLFQDDRLRGGLAGVGPAPAPPAGGPVQAIARVRLGPITTADVQYHVPAPRVRDLVVYAVGQYRAPYTRDGVRVDGSETRYLTAGARMLVPLAPGRDLLVGSEARHSPGLATGGGLTTARYTAAGLTAGLSQRLGRLVAQPFVRGQIGTADGRGTDRGRGGGFRGLAGGLTLLTRF